LGAGAAVILSLKLKADYPNLRCIAYSPPGGLISPTLAKYTKSYVMSVVVGDDIIPRLSIRSVHNLKADIFKVRLFCCKRIRFVDIHPQIEFLLLLFFKRSFTIRNCQSTKLSGNIR
jgi:hypothetical protein